ncbi:uncharacterized protein LOC111598243 isoform X2 [Drosophila hydei]|uniref:Uncharacterized protein LOC111598243 isoform X2 n=1 Tax=Drosophila hydei TaxID=7224 RepID=A0A6J1LS86_DROHY|nr:uncharacterized protein LOC111598243 isoform X2 [Drosophila hydei]
MHIYICIHTHVHTYIVYAAEWKMFKVRKFEFRASESKCRSFSIWNFCPITRWQQLWEFIGGCTPCRYEFFPYIFWLVLIISLMGAYGSLGECIRIYCISSQPLEMWRPRKFFVFDMETLRRSRLVGAVIMSYVWLLMIYALVNCIQKSLSAFDALPLVVGDLRNCTCSAQAASCKHRNLYSIKNENKIINKKQETEKLKHSLNA